MLMGWIRWLFCWGFPLLDFEAVQSVNLRDYLSKLDMIEGFVGILDEESIHLPQ